MSDPYQPGSPYESPKADMGYQPPGMPSKDECNSAMLAHLLGALIGIIGPLIIYLTKKDDSPFVEDQGKEALNFHLTLIIAYLVSTVLYTILMIVTCGFGMFLPLPLAVTIYQLIMGIIASTRANNGEYYRYPATIRMIT